MSKEDLNELFETLRGKGWSEEEIQKLSKVYSEENVDDSSSAVLKKVVYWLSLMVGIIGNLTFSALIVFLILFWNKWITYAILLAFGFLFGFIYFTLIKDLEQLDQEHKIIMDIFVPAMALINVFVFIMVTKGLNPTIDIFTWDGPIVMSLLYAYSFTLPYFINRIKVYRKSLKIQN